MNTLATTPSRDRLPPVGRPRRLPLGIALVAILTVVASPVAAQAPLQLGPWRKTREGWLLLDEFPRATPQQPPAQRIHPVEIALLEVLVSLGALVWGSGIRDQGSAVRDQGSGATDHLAHTCVSIDMWPNEQQTHLRSVCLEHERRCTTRWHRDGDGLRAIRTRS